MFLPAIRRAAVLYYMLIVSPTIFACTCAPLEMMLSENQIGAFFETCDSIVHARIVELISRHEGRIEIVESFKGRPKVLKANRLPEYSCGTSFHENEEAIFIVVNGKVSLCGLQEATPERLQRLREHKELSQHNK